MSRRCISFTARWRAAATPLHFIEQGFYDSNTLFANPECTNPLYRIGVGGL
jgi:hypothetical protein